MRTLVRNLAAAMVMSDGVNGSPKSVIELRTILNILLAK
jgi:hypothetical protein